MRITRIDDSTAGVDGCGKKIVYKLVHNNPRNIFDATWIANAI